MAKQTSISKIKETAPTLPPPTTPIASTSSVPKPKPLSPLQGTSADEGVGGDSDSTFSFKIGVLKNDGKSLDSSQTVRMELAPVRRSTFEKAGMQPPGASSGIELRSRANIAKMTIPGARPAYQHMGIAEETLEWVGAFIGTDVEQGDSADYDKASGSVYRTNQNLSAWDQSQSLTKIFKKGRKLGIELNWFQEKPNQHSVSFTNNVIFKGYIKDFIRSYATEQRVYYRISFAITNREDIDADGFLLFDNRDVELKRLFPDDSLYISLPSPSSSKENIKRGRELSQNNGHTPIEYKNNGITLSDKNKLAAVIVPLRDDKGMPISFKERQDVNKAVDTYLSIMPYIENKNADLSQIKNIDEIKEASSNLTRILDNGNNSPELQTARDGIELVSRRYNKKYEGIVYSESHTIQLDENGNPTK